MTIKNGNTPRTPMFTQMYAAGNGAGFYIENPFFNVQMITDSIEITKIKADLSGGFFYIKRG